MARYGLPYRGSKSTIAEWVVDHLPSSSTLVDLFAGGCAITHAALLSGKYERIIANDLGDAPQVFMDAVSGEYAGYVTVPDREEFHAKKETDPPYRNTGQDGYKLESTFDYKAFDAWLQEIDHPVIVSEYACPTGCVQIACKQKAVTMSSGSAKKAQEGLFIQEQFKDWYDQTMREQSNELF